MPRTIYSSKKSNDSETAGIFAIFLTLLTEILSCIRSDFPSFGRTNYSFSFRGFKGDIDLFFSVFIDLIVRSLAGEVEWLIVESGVAEYFFRMPTCSRNYFAVKLIILLYFSKRTGSSTGYSLVKPFEC